MSVNNPPTQFAVMSSAPLPAVTRAFHWATVGLVASMFTLIWAAYLSGSGPLGSWLVNLHRSVGVTLFFVVVARLMWRITHIYPPLPSSVPSATQWLAGGVHLALYAGLLAMPLIGWIASDMAGDTVRIFGIFTMPSVFSMNEGRSGVLFVIHGWVATTLLIAMTLHILGAMRHHFILRDGVASRML